MFIRISNPTARKRLVAHLRAHDYLAAEVPGGIAAQPQNAVSQGYDRSTLISLIRQWQKEHASDRSLGNVKPLAVEVFSSRRARFESV